ncbi:hypothetical protein A359_07370 [secondary endosymbiont of Ctenarytaina eucalypti]|uniref:Uncharacterized protein n=1 Tax=secondary endosymbiont of Ctenarytaina eucalypti TaxID=1199245 RepID=J3YSB3_9ENTR|nr:hypothetical protein A359_07370 [secondary endosymbiont of Ctenarytaina eucalypti]
MILEGNNSAYGIIILDLSQSGALMKSLCYRYKKIPPKPPVSSRYQGSKYTPLSGCALRKSNKAIYPNVGHY